MPAAPVTIDLDASDASSTRLERHSYVNLINVIHAELQLIERMINMPGSLRSAIHLAEAVSRAFREPRVARRHLSELARFGDLVESDVHGALEEAGEAAQASDVEEARAILFDVLPDAHLRVQEVLARHQLPRPLCDCTSDELRNALARQNADVSLRVEHDVLRLPEGFRRAVASLAAKNDRGTRVDSVELSQGSSTRLVARGHAPRDYFAPAWQNLRPSELHPILATHGEPLRAVLLLNYYTVPDGRLEISTTDSSAFELTVELAGTTDLIS